LKVCGATGIFIDDFLFIIERLNQLVITQTAIFVLSSVFFAFWGIFLTLPVHLLWVRKVTLVGSITFAQWLNGGHIEK